MRYEAADAPSLGGAFATSAPNVCAALGPVPGGAAIDGGLGYRAPVWVSALLTTPALAALTTTARDGRARRPA